MALGRQSFEVNKRPRFDVVVSTDVSAATANLRTLAAADATVGSLIATMGFNLDTLDASQLRELAEITHQREQLHRNLKQKTTEGVALPDFTTEDLACLAIIECLGARVIPAPRYYS